MTDAYDPALRRCARPLRLGVNLPGRVPVVPGPGSSETPAEIARSAFGR